MPMIQEVDVSQDFICPISHEIMLDPVVDSQGRAYERESITRWINEHGTHPTDRTPMKVEQLQNAPGLTRQIRVFVDANQILIDNQAVYIPANTGDLFVKAVKSNDMVTLRYLTKIVNGHASEQTWKDLAFLTATEEKKIEIMRFLRENNAGMTSENLSKHIVELMHKKLHNHVILLCKIGEEMGDTSWKDLLLHAAIERNDIEIVDYCCDLGANLSSLLKTTSRESHNPLMKAMVYCNGDRRMIELLMRRGASVHLEHENYTHTAEEQKKYGPNSHMGAYSNGSYNIYGYLNRGNSNTNVNSKDAQLARLILELEGRRMQVLCDLPEQVRALKATVAQQSEQIEQQSAQIAQLLEALQQQQQATAAGGAEKPASTAHAAARFSARSRSPEPGQAAAASANQAASHSQSPSH